MVSRAVSSITEDGISLHKITVEDYFQDRKHPDNKRFHNLAYIEKVADIPGGRTSGKNRSGGTAIGISTTGYKVAEIYGLVKQYAFWRRTASKMPSEMQSLLEDTVTPWQLLRGASLGRILASPEN